MWRARPARGRQYLEASLLYERTFLQLAGRLSPTCAPVDAGAIIAAGLEKSGSHVLVTHGGRVTITAGAALREGGERIPSLAALATRPGRPDGAATQTRGPAAGRAHTAFRL